VEAVFSSSEDRIRASLASVRAAGPPVVARENAVWGTFFQSGRFWAKTAARSLATTVAESLFATLFPSDCRLCAQPLLNISRLPVCPDCLARIQPIRGKVCSTCGERVLSSYAAEDASGRRTCPVCRRMKRPFARAIAYGSYEGELRELIHLLKYGCVRPAADVLGRVLGEAMAALDSGFEQRTILVIPVPLHKSKYRQRGFNQAELIARAALKAHKSDRLQLATGVLQRIRETESQIGLTSHQRRANLRGAFAVPRTAEVTGREVLLVDDVYTTGATMTECAQVVRRSGAAKVWVATVARTLKLASKVVEIEPEEAEFGQASEGAVPLAKAVGT